MKFLTLVFKHTFIISIILSYPLTSLGQKSLDILSLSGVYVMPTTYNIDDSKSVEESQKNIALTLPVVISEKTIIYNNINYYNFRLKSDQIFENGIAVNLNLYGFIGRFGVIKKLKENSGVQLLVVPRHMSDFKSSARSKWQLGAIGLYEYRYNKDLMMRYGLMYNKEFFGDYLVPMLYIDWNVSRKVSVAGMLPVYLKIKYHHNERLEYGISYSGLTTSYRLGEDYHNDYIVRESLNFAIYQRYHLGNNIHLETRIGYAVGRNYDQFSNNQKIDLGIPLKNFNDKRTNKSPRLKKAAFLNVKLVYSLSLDK